MSTETSDDTTPESQTQTNWRVAHDDVEPIRIRDPVAETLGVLAPGDPFVVDYLDVVTAAGHSCPTAAGAYRLTQRGLDALYPDALPVRGDVDVLAGGPKTDSTYGVMARLVSHVTGAAEADGFGGLAGGLGDRRDRLHYHDLDTIDPTFRFRRRDTADVVEVRYHVADVPALGPAGQHLPAIVDGTASTEDREQFAAAWHARVQTVLTDDDLFSVTPADWPLD